KLFSLQRKVAIVTGASRGIGYCITEFLAAAGATVVMSSGCQVELDLLADELKQKGYAVTCIACDVEKSEELEALVNQTIALHGPLAILVINVVINPLYDSIQEMDIADCARPMNINVTAPFLLSKLCLPQLRESSNASMVNISAAEGLKPEPKMALS